MIYLIAILWGLLACVQGYAVEVVKGNISHLKNGREPNAGACLFPALPAVPLMSVFIAWLIELFIPTYSIEIFLIGLSVMSIILLISFISARLEYLRLIKTKKSQNENGA